MGRRGVVPRRILRWIPAAALAVTLAVSWALLFSGGMRAVVGWLAVVSPGQLIGPLTLLAVVTHAIRKRRFSRPMQAAFGLAVFSLWPALWSFGLLAMTFPASKATTVPSATVRIPADGPVRVVWGGDRVEVNHHASTPDQRWAYDLVIEPAMSGSARLGDFGCYGKPVLAPVAGRIHFTIDGEPDQMPGKLSLNFQKPLGNAVVRAGERDLFVDRAPETGKRPGRRGGSGEGRTADRLLRQLR